MKIRLLKSIETASIYSRNNIVYKVNDKFLQMFGYGYNEIVGKSLKELSALLKIDSQTSFEDIIGEENLYIFNNKEIPKDVIIRCESYKEGNRKIYNIEEKTNTTLEFMLENFGYDHVNRNEAQAVYSYPGLICLKSNIQYKEALDLINIKYGNLIGSYHPSPKYLSEIVEYGAFHGSGLEYISSDGRKSYWDVSMRLIKGQGKNMFILSALYESTDRVVEKRLQEKQRLEMEIILDNISDSINKVNNKGKFTYLNKAAKDKLSPYTLDFESLDDKKQFEFFKYNDINGKELAFKDTPIQRVLRDETISDEIIIGTSNRATSYHQVNGFPIHDKEGNVDSCVLVYKDIKNTLMIDEYEAFKDNMKDTFLRYAVLSYDDFKIKYMNKSAMLMVKKHNPNISLETDIIGRNFFDYYYLAHMEKEVLMRKIKKAIEKKESYSIKQTFEEEEEEEEESKYIKTIFHPKYDKNGQVEKIEVVDVDITDEEISNKMMAKALKIQDESL